MKKWKIITVSLLLLVVVCWLFRFSIFRSFGNYLVDEDELKKSEVMFVLGGGAYDRGNEAVKIFKQGFAKKIICTSGNFPKDYEALGLPYAESDVTKINITRQGVPDSLVVVIREGTSTFEEADIIIDYCRKNNIRSFILLSSKFHTHRIRSVFTKKLKNENAPFKIKEIKKIPQAYIHKIDTSNFKEPLYFKAVVLVRKKANELGCPLYEMISKKEFNSVRKNISFGKIILEKQ